MQEPSPNTTHKEVNLIKQYGNILILAIMVVPSISVAGDTKFSGDFRFRYEADNNSSKDDSRDRQRLRLRFSMSKDLGMVKVGGRLSTNSENIQSPHHTLGFVDASDNSGFGLDRAYMQISPQTNLKIILGKTGVNWWQQNEVLMDGDISPEGAALTYGLGPIKLNAAQYIFAEQNWNGVFKDDNLTMIQGVYNGEFGNIKAIMSGGLAIIDYQDTSNTDRQVQSLSAQINANNYTVGFDYFTSDMTADNSGMVGMLKAKFGQYKVSLWYYDVPQNSTIQSSLSQDNFPNSVGFDGYRFQVGFKLFEHIGTDIRYYMQNMDSDVDISRIQLNLNVKY